MKKILTITISLLLGLSLFANDIEAIKKAEKIEKDLYLQTESIGIEASLLNVSDEEKIKFIEKRCEGLLSNFDYIQDEELVKRVVKPNCLEYSLEFSRN